MRMTFFLALALAACGANGDRLTDDQAGAAPNAPTTAVDQPAPAPANGVAQSYKAVGTEPGWALTVKDGIMTYEGDYGSVKISEPVPASSTRRPWRSTKRRWDRSS